MSCRLMESAVPVRGSCRVTVEQLYAQTVKLLSVAERLHLATLILNDIPAHAVVDYREAWDDEDLHDFCRTTWEHLDSRLEEDTEHA